MLVVVDDDRPLPPILLDLLITLNIVGAALAILVTTLYVQRALDFAAFPSLLLLTTLFRLAINVASRGSILLHGDAGSVIQAFGNFVVGGNVVVGLVVFLILVVIQFVVITNGAGRVAEVAARFTLDAMPGKQMAIDADLNAGQITDDEARQRREEIRREADFYGAMDGASKFVKGDAIAGVLIVTINLIGGIVVGVVQQHMSFSHAIQHFSLLTVGDGLAAQIPALLISAATGILVTRSAPSTATSATRSPASSSASRRAARRRRRDLRAWRSSRGCRSCRSCSSAARFVVIGRTRQERHRRPAEAERGGARGRRRRSRRELASPRDAAIDALVVDPLELAIGFGLVPMVDKTGRRRRCSRASASIRRQIAAELGIVDRRPSGSTTTSALESHEYVIKVRGAEVARGRVDGRPPARDGPRRRRRPAAGDPDHRARLRPARASGSTTPRRPRPRRSATPSSTPSR